MAYFGEVTHVSVDANRKTAIVRFKDIQSAKDIYLRSREINEATGKREVVFSSPNENAHIVYVIPEQSKED